MKESLDINRRFHPLCFNRFFVMFFALIIKNLFFPCSFGRCRCNFRRCCCCGSFRIRFFRFDICFFYRFFLSSFNYGRGCGESSFFDNRGGSGGLLKGSGWGLYGSGRGFDGSGWGSLNRDGGSRFCWFVLLYFSLFIVSLLFFLLLKNKCINFRF